MSKTVAIVLSCYNEEKNIPVVFRALQEALANTDVHIRYIFVDDGSTDGTLTACKALLKEKADVRIVQFSRNFGHEIAMTAGLDYAGEADSVIFMDSDMQHPPALVPQMIALWEKGADIVLTRRANHHKKSLFYRLFSATFYGLLNAGTDIKIEPDTPDFRLIDKCYLPALRACREPDRLFRGLINWLKPSSKCAVIPFQVPQRHSGESKYTFGKCLTLAGHSFVQSSVKPLFLAYYIGTGCLFLGGIMGAVALYQHNGLLGLGGFIALLGAGQFYILGLIGTYLAKVHKTVQARPLYCAKIWDKGV